MLRDDSGYSKKNGFEGTQLETGRAARPLACGYESGVQGHAVTSDAVIQSTLEGWKVLKGM